jgi:hypothetical protein
MGHAMAKSLADVRFAADCVAKLGLALRIDWLVSFDRPFVPRSV